MFNRMAGSQCRCLTIIVFAVQFLFLSSSGTSFLEIAANVSTCVGQNVTLNWRFNDSDVFIVYWRRGHETLLINYIYGSTIYEISKEKLQFIENGVIKLKNVSTNDTGNYFIQLSFKPGMNISIETQSAFVTVKAAPSPILNSSASVGSGSDANKTFICNVTHAGVPAVEEMIKVGNSPIKSSFVTTDLAQPVDCCVVGEAVRCLADNGNGMSTFCKRVYNPYGPEKLRLDPYKSNYTVKVRQTIDSINCSADCDPPCTYSWFKGESPIESSSGVLPSLTIGSEADSGTYTCTAVRRYNHTHSTSFTVFVIYGPDSVTFTPHYTEYIMNEGRTLHNIRCQADCYPECSLIWKKGQNITSTNDILSLEKLDRHEAGSYICIAKSTRLEQSSNRSLLVIVNYGPDKVSISEGNETVDEGVKISPRTCLADCVPPCNYTWSKPAKSQANYTTDTLIFKNIILRQDAGDYTCLARNPVKAGEQSDTFTLHVRYFPDLNVSIDSGSGVLNKDDENVTLICTARGEPANFTVFDWIHIAPDNKTEIQTHAGIKSGSKNHLVLQRLSYMDSGFYRCNVSNEVKDYRTDDLYATKDIKLTKIGEPQVITQSTQVFVAVNSNAELKISFYSNDDTSPVVTWFKKDNESRTKIKTSARSRFNFQIFNTTVTVLFYRAKVNLTGFTSQLHISDVSPSDLGVYQIFINNSVGYNFTMLNVTAAGPPDVPKYFQANLDSATDSSISLTWQSGFHGGGNQTFYIEFRKKGSTEWQIVLRVLGGQEEAKHFNAAVHNLTADTAYEFRIYAKNIFNQSDAVTTEGNTTSIKEVKQTEPFPVGAAAGGGIAAAAVMIIIVVLVVVWKKRSKEKLIEADIQETVLTPKGHPAANVHEDVGEVNLNPMYESSDTMQLPATNVDEYAKVKKQSLQPSLGTSADVYSVVNKRKENCSKSSKDKKKKKDVGQRKPKTSKEVDGTVYENAESTTEKSKAAENVYENPVCSSYDEKPSRTKNDDGLIYIEVELPQKKDAENNQPVIHGEDRTIYADVAYGQVGEQSPESDDEKK